MSYGSFTSMPALTEFWLHSVDVGKAVSASLDKDQSAALLVMTTATEFLFVAVAAYFGAVLCHRSVLRHSRGRDPRASLLGHFSPCANIGELPRSFNVLDEEPFSCRHDVTPITRRAQVSTRTVTTRIASRKDRKGVKADLTARPCSQRW